MKSSEIRKKFITYFKNLGHEYVASSSLIPTQDPTLLFTNAGMNQFKDVFLGKEKRSYDKAVSVQKCVRAGGKHNDLDNVGFTKRHLTFFEMLGNFSFGSYFKKQAIPYAWNFLTKDLGLDPQDLCVSVHHSDDEAYEIWKNDIGVAPEKIYRLGADNFWQMGDVGPCGPCTEIFFDRQARDANKNLQATPETDGERFLEIWNVVFMQYDRQQDGKDLLLAQSGVDTGSGLERMAVVLQKKDSVFQTDVFAPCMKRIEDLTGYEYETSPADKKAAFNVLADHVRSSTFLISDGCAPSNEGRGYVLRKIIRRAALFAQKLTDKNIFPELAKTLIESMQEAYPELLPNKERIVSVLSGEIERFAENLIRGQAILEEYCKAAGNKKEISGEQAFKLYDTYGFPLEVVQLICQERGFAVSGKDFEVHMEKQRALSGKKMKKTTQELHLPEHANTSFTGYNSLHEDSTILHIIQNDQLVEEAKMGQEVWIIPAKTPFYVECGGQVNDEGVIKINNYETSMLDLAKQDAAIMIKIVAPCDFKAGDEVGMRVHEFARLQTMKNHTATHLLQAALQQRFGKQVKQAGSVVTKDLLRFDFTYHKPLSSEEIMHIEDVINQKIWENIPVVLKNMTYKEAIAQGVIAFFGEKYNQDNVRAIFIGDYSAELCGGTHVRSTGDIGSFKIVEESALAAGQRRMVAITGWKALKEFQKDFALVKDASLELKVKPDAIMQTILQLKEEVKDFEKQLKSMKKDQWKAQLPNLLAKVTIVGKVPFGFYDLSDYDAEEMKDIIAALQLANPALYVAITAKEGKAFFIVSLHASYKDLVDLKKLKDLLANDFGLRGGGSALMIQGGGVAPKQVDLHQAISAWLKL